MHGSRPYSYRTENGDTVTVAQCPDGLWRWTRKSGNNRIVADGAEGYSRKDAGKRAALRTNPPKPRIR